MTPHLYFKYDGNRRGVLPEKLGGGCAARFLNPYPISDQNL